MRRIASATIFTYNSKRPFFDETYRDFDPEELLSLQRFFPRPFLAAKRVKKRPSFNVYPQDPLSCVWCESKIQGGLHGLAGPRREYQWFQIP